MPTTPGGSSAAPGGILLSTLDVTSSGDSLVINTRRFLFLKIDLNNSGAWGGAVVTMKRTPGDGQYYAMSTPVTFSSDGSSDLIDVRGLESIKLEVTTTGTGTITVSYLGIS